MVSANGIEGGLPISFLLQSENVEDLKATSAKVEAALLDMEGKNMTSVSAIMNRTLVI